MASAKDGDSKIYPLAFGFAPSECKGSWTWFLFELKKGIGSPQDLVIVSDRHRGIMLAIKKVFPNAQHAFCVFHIAQKFRRSSKNRSIAREFFYKACYRHYCDECDIDLQQMAACNQRSDLTLAADNHILKRVEPSYKCIIRPISYHGYNVTENQINSIVDIQAKTCAYREWDLDKLPCRHALACARYASISVPEMCSDYYRSDWMREAYRGEINPVPYVQNWVVLDLLGLCSIARVML
ncbi:hypothetical protein Q3G72_000305 [Acer saccharum]|nr:hypothetical protein Q3G72_000305 [Acer saccharum]